MFPILSPFWVPRPSGGPARLRAGPPGSPGTNQNRQPCRGRHRRRQEPLCPTGGIRHFHAGGWLYPTRRYPMTNLPQAALFDIVGEPESPMHFERREDPTT